ncbi:alanine dehydrogenase [Vagococcus xieshaowenii]|uniref:Alanine dehydrogenase n=1 Tax=Vagococcus xieshaowenii TaxID=2562451 RepID=A0AAJ5EGQ1_9ENTE|nr:alanine dehydrogenase [Vagococcus xieshaowenii]QCA28173.1 alanine dehydrogenase [Vagococcus xieshaowenii]TFZ42526.1 alanine dehydrogenase [Vagococcus xieshaowenii]
MKIGVIKDPKQGEARVGMTPENVKILTEAGHTVLVDNNAGEGSGFTNEMYTQAGGEIVDTDTAWEADLIVKVKEPMPSEYHYFKKGQIIWGFLHLAANKECVQQMVDKEMIAISGENISVNGVLELLKPMSAIAGRRAVCMGQYYLEKQHGGEGILLPGIPGLEAGTIVILGGGNAAENAADIGASLGCRVIILELNENRLKQLEERYSGKNVELIESTTENLEKYIKEADIFISTVLIPGAKPPKLVKEYMVKSMKQGSVLVDISIDQGGTVETIDTPTTHADPVFEKYGVIHYAVPNMPGATPRTATMALAKGNISYLLDIANKGVQKAIKDSEELKSGVSMYEGKIVSEALADSIEMNFVEMESVL